MLLEETDGYRTEAPGERTIKRTHGFIIDDLKVYQESHRKLEAYEVLGCEEGDKVENSWNE